MTAGRKLIRKNDRRQRKCQHVLEREANVTCSATPTKVKNCARVYQSYREIQKLFLP